MKVVLLGTTAACVLGFRADLIQALVAKGDEVYAFALDYNDAARAQVRAWGAHPVDYVFSRTGVNPVSDLWNTWRLAGQLRHIRPDVVLSYFSKPVVFGTLAARLAGCKRRIGMLEGLGYTFTQGPNGFSKKASLLRAIQVFLYRLSFPLLERIIFLNPDDPRDLVERYGLRVAKVSVLGGIGLDLQQYPFSEPRATPVSFIFVGRLLAEKGIHEYVGAARLVRQQHPGTEFVVLGGLDAANPGALSQQELDVLIQEKLVVYPGHVNNVQDWLIAASVFVLPSYYREGVPRSTQEAMAMGRAVITTDVPGCRETVVDGVNGYLVRPWSAEDLAQRMMQFVEHPEQAVQMGRESFRLAQERFDARHANKRLVGYIRGD